MIKQIKDYIILPAESTPKKEDIAEAINIAKKDNCVISLRWTIPCIGNYRRYIYDDDDVDDVYENRIPHKYSV